MRTFPIADRSDRRLQDASRLLVHEGQVVATLLGHAQRDAVAVAELGAKAYPRSRARDLPRVSGGCSRIRTQTPSTPY